MKTMYLEIIAGLFGITLAVLSASSTTVAAEETGSAFGILRYTIPPGGEPGFHIHRGEDKFFYVLNGAFDFQLRALMGGVTPAGFEGYFIEWQGADENSLHALRTKHNMEFVGPPLQYSIKTRFRKARGSLFSTSMLGADVHDRLDNGGNLKGVLSEPISSSSSK